jgi:hypothetical protein
MLIVGGLAPTSALRNAFPAFQFLSLAGRSPIVLWFARVWSMCYRDPAGGERCDADGGDLPYDELTVLALLRQRAFFVPVILANGERTIRIGWGRYGMPKRPVAMVLRMDRAGFAAQAIWEGRESFVRAKFLTGGRSAGRIVSRLWPRRAWTAWFPSGTRIRARIEATPRVQLAHVRAGCLSLPVRWLPRPAPFLPLGLYLPGQVMELPPP